MFLYHRPREEGLVAFLCLFLGSPAVSTFEAGLIALEDGLNAAAIHVLAKRGLAA